MGGGLSTTRLFWAPIILGAAYGYLQRKTLLLNFKVFMANKVVGATVKKLLAPGNVCELQKVKIDGEEYRVFKNAPSNLVEIFMEGRRNKDLDYLVFTGKPGYEGRRLTFAQFAEEAAMAAHVLKTKFKVKHGDRVGIMMSNMIEYVVSLAAITSLGAVAVLFNAFWEREESLASILEAEPEIIIIDDTRLSRLGESIGDLTSRGIRFIMLSTGVNSVPRNKEIYSYQELMKVDTSVFEGKDPFDYLHTFAASSLKAQDTALILYTSGTTSTKAKGVVLTHFSVTQSIESYNLFLEVMKAIKGKAKIQRCDLVGGPLFHTSGMLSILLAFRGGHKCVFFPKWNVDALVDVLIKEQVTYFPGVPTTVMDMLHSQKFVENKDNYYFENIGTGGAPIQPSTVAGLQALFPHISQGTGWGMTETCALGTAIGGPEFLKSPRSCGRPQAIVDIKIIDPVSLEDIRQPNMPGELCIHSPTVMKEYFKMPKETKESFLPGTRWYRTGDVGVFDENGLYYITDRVKEIVIRGGENISCREVEAIISEMTGIAEVAAFGVPDERLGEMLFVAVVPKEGFRFLGKDVQDYVAKRLAKFKVPSHVIICDEPLPRNAAGKVVKAKIKCGITPASVMGI